MGLRGEGKSLSLFLILFNIFWIFLVIFLLRPNEKLSLRLLGIGNGEITLLFFVEGLNEIVSAFRDNPKLAHPEGFKGRQLKNRVFPQEKYMVHGIYF